MSTQDLETRYTGQTARDYLSVRTREPHWKKEHRAVAEYLSKLHLRSRATVVDIPVGTGRFFELYEALSAQIVGFDISEDMLAVAEEIAQSRNLSVTLNKANINSIPMADLAADVVVCVRYMQHVDIESYRSAVSELTRISRKAIIIGIHSRSTGIASSLRALIFLLTHIPYSLRRIKAALLRRSSMEVPPEVSTAAALASSQPEERLLEEFERRGFAVHESTLVLTGLKIVKPIFYKLYLLERSPCGNS